MKADGPRKRRRYTIAEVKEITLTIPIPFRETYGSLTTVTPSGPVTSPLSLFMT